MWRNISLKLLKLNEGWRIGLNKLAPGTSKSCNPEKLRFDEIVQLLSRYAPRYTERQQKLIADAIVSLPHDLALKNLVERAKQLGLRMHGVDVDAKKLQEIAKRSQDVRVSEQRMIRERDKAIAENIGRFKEPVAFLGGLTHIVGLEQLLKEKNNARTLLSYCITSDDEDIPYSIKKRFATTIALLKENREGQAVQQIAIGIGRNIESDIERNSPQYLRARIQEIENEFKKDSGLSACKTFSQSFFFHFKTYSEYTKNILQRQKSEFKMLVHTLACQQDTPEARRAIYNEFKGSPVITTHRNGGLWAIGRTDSRIELDNEIDNLNNQVTKKS